MSARGRDGAQSQSRGGSGAEALEAALAQLGHFELYQRYVLFMLCLPNLLSAMHSLNYVFVAGQVPFRCAVPECEGRSQLQFSCAAAQALLPTATAETATAATATTATAATATAATAQSAQSCRRFAPIAGLGNRTTCRREDFDRNQTIQCEMFVYQNMDTIFAEFGLACREWLRTLVGSVRNAALPIALLITGYVSDRWGRRSALCVFGGCAGALGLVKSFAIDYNMFVAFEFLEAALGYGFNSAAYVMVVEHARPAQRGLFACATGVAYGVGGMLFALAAWRLQRWRRLLRAIYAPALLLPFYCRLVDESPRWLFASGRRRQAADTLRSAAKWNKKTIDEDLLKAVEEGDRVCGGDRSSVAEVGSNPWLELVRSRTMLVRLLACGWCWTAAAFVYYGLTLNSVTLSGDKYVNFALNMAMEVVASLLLMMSLERYGRKKSIFASFLVCGFACIVPYFVSHSRTGLGLFFVGKLAITFAYNSVYVLTAELFPTRTRSSALAACSIVGRVGSLLAPQTPLLSLYVQALLYGLVSVVASCCVLAMPETRRTRLPLALRDAERLEAPPPAPPPPPPPPPPAPFLRVLAADTE